jgi:hypothetical protein
MATKTYTQFLGEEERDVMALIGLALISVQSTERLLKTILSMLLPEQPLITVDDLVQSENGLARNTLGQMLHKLRERTQLESGFDDRLEAFLKTRNTIAHNVDKLPGYDLKTEDGRKAASEALVEFVGESYFFSMRLMGIVREWAKHVGMPVPEGTPDDFLRELDERYAPAVQATFGITINRS